VTAPGNLLLIPILGLVYALSWILQDTRGLIVAEHDDSCRDGGVS